MNNIKIPLVIIGSGPASLTASIYLSRAKIKHVILTGDIKGGQLTVSPEIENFPGIPSISGKELMNNFENHAKQLGSECLNYIFDIITTVNFKTYPFILQGSINSYTTNAVIIATGSKPAKLNLVNEDSLTGHGISYCATCDGYFYKNKEVAVVGGGNTAIEEALFLSHVTNKVTLIHRRDKLRGEQILQERLMRNPKINVLWNHVVSSLHTREFEFSNHAALELSSLEVTSTLTNEVSHLDVSALFVAVGYHPNTHFLQNQVELDARGHILTENKSSKTSVKGVFAAGDVQDPHYKQAIISAGSGAVAALEAIKFLANNT